jgi:hypothetical protein
LNKEKCNEKGEEDLANIAFEIIEKALDNIFGLHIYTSTGSVNPGCLLSVMIEGPPGY